MSGGISHRGQFQHQNITGTASVASGLGLADTSMTVQTFGSGDDITLQSHALVYDHVNFWYNWTNRGSGSRRWMTIPDGSLSTLRAFAPLFRNGVYLGGDTNALQNFTTGSAPPGSGTWVKGDRVFNNYTVKGTATGIEYWYCQAAGTPGTWVPNRAMGTFTLTAAASVAVADTAVIGTNTRITITPTNAAAETLQAGANAIGVTTKTANTSFTVTTAGGGSAAGTETFDYVIFN
jgi:hypothetical protein